MKLLKKEEITKEKIVAHMKNLKKSEEKWNLIVLCLYNKYFEDERNR